MKRAVIYARLSDVRKGDTEGIERQIREGRAHAERLHLEVVEELIDNDLSAAKKKRRPAFERLMEGIAANEWDAVVLRSLDRWVRRPAELERIIEVVEKSKVKVDAIHGEIDLRTRQGRLSARIVTAVAMAEVEATIERVTDWHEDRAGRGLALHSRPGFGYRKIEGKMVIDPDEAEMIRTAAAKVLKGGTLAAIGREWGKSPHSVRTTLIAPRIAGLRVHRGKVIGDASWEPILDRVTWERVRAALNRPERASPGGDPHLLTGLVACWRCERTLNCAPHNNGTLRYFCRHCRAVRIVAEPLEDHVVEELFAKADRPDLDRAVRAEPEPDLEAVAAELQEIEAELGTLADEYGRGEITIGEWRRIRTGMNERADDLRKRLVQPAEREWQGRGGELAAAWDGMPIEEQRRILRMWFQPIVIGPGTIGRTGFDPGRVRF